MARRTRIPLLVAICVALLGAAPPSQARDGGHDDVRVTATCGAGRRRRAADPRRSWRDQGRVHGAPPPRGERWRIVLVHERRVAWRGTLRTSRASDSLRLRRVRARLRRPDQVTARASGPRGLTCVASATLAG